MTDASSESNAESVERWPTIDEFFHQRCRGRAGAPGDYVLIRHRPGEYFSKLYARLSEELARVLSLDDFITLRRVDDPPRGLSGELWRVTWITGMHDNVYVWDEKREEVIRTTGSIPDAERIAREATSHAELECDQYDLRVVIRGNDEFDLASDEQIAEAQ